MHVLVLVLVPMMRQVPRRRRRRRRGLHVRHGSATQTDPTTTSTRPRQGKRLANCRRLLTTSRDFLRATTSLPSLRGESRRVAASPTSLMTRSRSTSTL